MGYSNRFEVSEADLIKFEQPEAIINIHTKCFISLNLIAEFEFVKIKIFETGVLNKISCGIFILFWCGKAEYLRW